jgi:hypothetical protein
MCSSKTSAPLTVEVGLDLVRYARLRRVGQGDPDRAHQARVQVLQDVPLVAVHPQAARLATMTHLGVLDADAPLRGHNLAQRRPPQVIAHTSWSRTCRAAATACPC